MAMAAMRGPSIGSLKFRMGLLTSPFRAHFPLRACPDCMAHDTTNYGIAYWHLSHQFPGSWVCTEHSRLLLECKLKASSAQRFGWVLPDQSNLQSATAEPSYEAFKVLNQLAIAANSLALSPPEGGHFQPKFLAQTMRARLREVGMASANSRLKTQAIGQAFHVFMNPLRCIDELRELATTQINAADQACRYLHRVHSVTHTLRHLLMIVWLFEDWQSFLKAYSANTTTSELTSTPVADEQLPLDSKAELVNSVFRTECVRLATEQKLSATAIASQLGVAVATVITHLAAAGIQTQKRPKILRNGLPDELKSILREGASKQEASVQFGISVETVTRFLFSEVGLHQEWTAKRFERHQQHARERWTELLSGNRYAKLILLRSIAPDAYAWLYRNDREWLNSSNQDRLSRPFSGGRIVDWESRDQELATKTQIAIDGLEKLKSGKKIYMTRLLQDVPQLKPYINKLDLLPRTQHLLNQYMCRHKGRSDDQIRIT